MVILGVIGIVLLVVFVMALAVVLFYRLYFLRKPGRAIPRGNCIVSPADGKIVRILSIGRDRHSISKGLLGKVRLITKGMPKGGHIIVIMMTPMDVHFQRAPVSGVVEKTSYSRGKFLNAVKDASSLSALENEKNEITILNSRIGRVKVVQVAGFLARRIRCFVESGQKIDKGQELGLICLGSQVILVIPGLRLQVSEGQRVVDGETVIARF